MDETVDHAIPLDQSQVNLVTVVLHRAARHPHTAVTPEAAKGLEDNIPLSRLAAHWTGIVEQGESGEAVDIDGARLYMVKLSAPGWEQVRAVLSGHAAQLPRLPQAAPEGGSNLERARRALLLADHIKEVVSGR
ncbi:hypothetical protein [Streptomyces microflavus]|uniref:hypothetical protein n=1 Tax=Streptomyces microflavus TaxID=1919 RepID=UPI00339F8252